ncbi:MAG: UDP-N-acetylmuramoyl-L-alanine--D-glutamate ligase [Saprospiraceae bacterium]
MVILGGGESGVAAALLAQAKDTRYLSPTSVRRYSRRNCCGLILPLRWPLFSSTSGGGRGDPESGHPRDHPSHELSQPGISVWSEIEFASRFIDGQILAITGTNGKTTTTHLVHHLFEHAGRSVACGGNIGNALARLAMQSPVDWYILELSSFQLDDIDQFHPRIAIILNVTPDHLDRYENNMARYARAKLQISLNQTAQDTLILQQGNAYLQDGLKEVPVRAMITEVGHPEGEAGDWLLVDGHRYDLSSFVLRGTHNLYNTTCAILAARKAGLTPQEIQAALPSFKPVSHRMEPIGSRQGVDYINDSKATNVDAVWYALQAMNQPVVWIAGRRIKEMITLLIELAGRRSRPWFALAWRQANSSMPLMVSFPPSWSHVPCPRLFRLRAVLPRQEIASCSPRRAQFDLFRNYEHRGQCFREAFHELETENLPCH